MRPWRLLIEVSEKQEEALVASPTSPAAPATIDRSGAWETLKNARRNLVAATTRGDTAAISEINNWIGGGLAMMSNMTGESSKTLLDRLVSEVPSASVASALVASDQAIAGSSLVIESARPQAAPGSNAKFYPVERTRPAPPPGAPKALKPEDLTPEERAELGMFLPGEEPPEAPATAKKAPAKKAPAKKAPAKKASPKKATA